MADRDYYDILGVSRDATADQIKKAYRGQARKYHPDVNPGDKQAEARFKETQEAYDVLYDSEKRALYDRYGKAGFQGVGSYGPRTGAWDYRTSQSDAETINFDFSDLFGPGGAGGMTAEGEPTGGAGSIFEELIGRVRGGGGAQGARGKRGGPRPAPATEAELSIPFLTAVQGGKTSIELTRANGRQETLEVKIPPGTDTGSKLRLKGRGEPAAPGAAGGDLIIKVKVQPHPYFRREGRDLSVDIPISIGEAVLGARIEVPTLDGSKTLPIPAGTSSGQKLRLKGQGVPAAGSKPAGDLYVVPRIQAPKNVDDQSRKLIEQFTERNPSTPRDGLW